MVHIRPAAAQEIQRLLRWSGSAESATTQVYLTLEPGGCADWTYRLHGTPISSQRATTVIACGDLSLVVPTDQLDLVQDLAIDYAEDLMGGGFRFNNPLAQRTCGCGNAFALSADTPIVEVEDCTGLSPLGSQG